MGDLISRQAVLNLKQTFTDNAGYETEYVDVEDIKELPSISSVENKGEWVFDGFCGEFGYDDRCKCHCSNCNNEIIVDGVYIVGEGYRMNPEKHTPNFCSNCGSDMRKEN